jgi:septal ring factor EnvC (AmiA/AmiB activator)
VTQEDVTIAPGPRFSANWTHFLYAGLILLVCVAFYQAAQTESLLRKIAASQRDNVTLRKNLSHSEEDFRRSLVMFRTELESLRTELADARQQADASLDKAQAATHYADVLAGNVEKKRRDQEKRQQQLSAQLTQVQKSTEETSTRLNGISNEVGGVLDTLDTVRDAAMQNSADLEHTRGDLGALKNGIATNSKEIQTLRDLGDRDIFEFALTKMGGSQRVGDIQLKLTRTDEKKSSFTVEIAADDKRVEKRDKTINEPVQFFVSSKPTQPYELIVNEVSRNGVKGYLSAPRNTIARN